MRGRKENITQHKQKSEMCTCAHAHERANINMLFDPGGSEKRTSKLHYYSILIASALISLSRNLMFAIVLHAVRTINSWGKRKVLPILCCPSIVFHSFNYTSLFFGMISHRNRDGYFATLITFPLIVIVCRDSLLSFACARRQSSHSIYQTVLKYDKY